MHSSYSIVNQHKIIFKMSPRWEFSDKIYVPLPVAILDFGPWRQMCVVKMGMVILNSLFY